MPGTETLKIQNREEIFIKQTWGRRDTWDQRVDKHLWQGVQELLV